jgi:hypothetical protein
MKQRREPSIRFWRDADLFPINLSGIKTLVGGLLQRLSRFNRHGSSETIRVPARRDCSFVFSIRRFV